MVKEKYNVICTFIKDPSKDTTNVLFDTSSGLKNVINFKQIKSCLDNNIIPFASIIVQSVTQEDIIAFNSGLILAVVSITQKDELLYRNAYHIKKVNVMESTEKILTLNTTQLLIESTFISRLKADNTFYILNRSGDNFKNEDVLGDINNFLISQYGSGVNILSYHYGSSTNTRYTSRKYSVQTTNLNHLKEIVTKYQFSTNPILFGIDEGFVSEHSTELIYIDLLNAGLIFYGSEKVTDFEKNDYDTKTPSKVLKPYFDQSFINKYINNKIRYKESRSGDVFEIPDNKIFDTKQLKMIRTDGDLMVSAPDNCVRNVTFLEGTLSENDIKKVIEKKWELYSYNPVLYLSKFDWAPYDLFRLGRRLKLDGLFNTNIVVSSDVEFSVAESNEAKNPGDTVLPDRYICHGQILTMSYNIT